jgi:hypothetical protein
MITNDVQYRTAKAQAARLESLLADRLTLLVVSFDAGSRSTQSTDN